MRAKCGGALKLRSGCGSCGGGFSQVEGIVILEISQKSTFPPSTRDHCIFRVVPTKPGLFPGSRVFCNKSAADGVAVGSPSSEWQEMRDLRDKNLGSFRGMASICRCGAFIFTSSLESWHNSISHSFSKCPEGKTFKRIVHTLWLGLLVGVLRLCSCIGAGNA